MVKTPSSPRNPQVRRQMTHGLLVAAALGLGVGGWVVYSHRGAPPAHQQAGPDEAQIDARLELDIRRAPHDPAPRLRRIEFLLSRTRNADALDAAREAALALPEDRDVRAALADCLAATGRAREAIRLLSEEAPGETGPRLQLARYLIQDGQAERGAALARSVSDPTPGQALTAAQLLIDAREPDAAVAVLKPVQLRAPGGETRNHAAFALLVAGRYREAAELLLAAVRESPEVPTLHFYAGSALRLSGDLERLAIAEAELRQAATQAAQDGFFQYELALCLAQRRNWEGARDALETAAKLSPETPEIQRDLAHAYTKTKQPLPAALARARYLRLVDAAPAAVKVLEPLAAQDPENTELGLALSVALHAASRFSQATALVEKLRSRHPDVPDVIWSQYRLQTALKQYDQALGSLQSLEKEVGPDPVVLSERALTLQQLARHAEAEEILFKLRDLEPESAERHYNLGTALSLWSARADAEQLAEGELRRAVALRPDYAAAHYALGQLLQSRGASAEAIVHLRRAADFAPTHVDAQRLLGRAYLQVGDRARSDEAFRMYRWLDQRVEERKRLELPVRHMEDLRRSRMALARFDLRNGNPKNATIELERLVYQFPEDREAHRLLAGLYGYERRFQAQFEERQWLRTHPLPPGAAEPHS
jgi:Flp pilus assembly protein TadD